MHLKTSIYSRGIISVQKYILQIMFLVAEKCGAQVQTQNGRKPLDSLQRKRQQKTAAHHFSHLILEQASDTRTNDAKINFIATTESGIQLGLTTEHR